MTFIPNTENEVREMMALLGIESIEELFKDIPREVLFKDALDIPRLSEFELTRYLGEKLSRNRVFPPEKVFLGGGVWPVYIPAVVRYILMRTEFLTAYTPYQAEISQGLMQALYEYQSLLAELLDIDVVNSSMYDWSSAAAEALLLSVRATKGDIVLIPRDIPYYRKMVLKTYLWGAGVEYMEYPLDEEGNIDVSFLNKVDGDRRIAGLYVEYPNVYGYIMENLDEASEYIHNRNGLFIVGVDPLSLPILKPPSAYGADIVVGEGQPLGNPSYFGGPLLGIFGVRRDMKLIREMPGRIIGLTRTVDGKRAFAMILQTREQHIRRERATSNICSNEALSAVASAVYISLLGKNGLIRLSMKLLRYSHMLYEMLASHGFKQPYNLPYFREFSLVLDKPIETSSLLKHMINKGFLFGAVLARYHTVSLNEHHSQQALEELTSSIEEVIG